MLNRNAEALFWVGRYMERAENHARLIDVHYHQQEELGDLLAAGGADVTAKWVRIVDALGSRTVFEQRYESYKENDVAYYVTLDPDNENSLLSCVNHARSNLRTLREKLPAELWDVMNAFYLWLRDKRPEELLRDSPHRFFLQVKEWAALFLGSAQSVMPRENEWHFMECGRYLERAENTLRILQSNVSVVAEDGQANSYMYLQAVLKSVGAYHAFRRYYADSVTIESIAEFLVLHGLFPRSVQFALNQLGEHLKGIELLEASLKPAHNKVIRQAAKLLAELSCMEREELLLDREGNIIAHLLRSCEELGIAVANTFFRIGEVSA
ncbi:alpha-E domain-containing protein [Paenibacillus alkalitolerans]|uniref:alpha-E domain-containing protein n=1 Tax=Paenibacillus alkalitolerans TaxID=2799335 RepID=UPI0018F54488|nr:alpha-E domain-containing protein [Paenibacillus alkalitolerans]